MVHAQPGRIAPRDRETVSERVFLAARSAHIVIMAARPGRPPRLFLPSVDLAVCHLT